MAPRSSLEGSSLGLNGRGIPGGPHCLPQGAPHLTQAQMKATLRDSAETIRKVFVDRGADKVANTKVKIEDWVRDKSRHFAACKTNGALIVLASELALQPPKVMAAIIAHEFGHATDFCYPGSFLIQPDGNIAVRPQGMRSNQSLPREVMAHWDRRNSDDIERTADRIAERIMGIKIGYCGPCNLQTMLMGTPDEARCKYPRPGGLR